MWGALLIMICFFSLWIVNEQIDSPEKKNRRILSPLPSVKFQKPSAKRVEQNPSAEKQLKKKAPVHLT